MRRPPHQHPHTSPLDGDILSEMRRRGHCCDEMAAMVIFGNPQDFDWWQNPLSVEEGGHYQQWAAGCGYYPVYCWIVVNQGVKGQEHTYL